MEPTSGLDDLREPLLLGDTDTTNLTIRAAKGVSWAGLFQALAQPLTLLTTVVLARLLTPTDFGLMGMAGIVMGLIALLNELGLASAVIQKEKLNQLELSSLFWFNLGIGVAFTIIGVALAWPVAWYFHRPILVPMLATMSIAYTMASIVTIHGALMTRRMEFRILATYAFIGTVIQCLSALVLAGLGAGVWSLVFSSLIGPILPIILQWRRVKWRPSWVFEWTSCRPLIGFGANITISSLLGYGSSNVDYIVIGRVLGAAALGTYTFAFNLMLFPMRRFSSLLINATYPAFARIQNESERFKRAYLRSSGLLTIVAAPLLLAALVAAPEIIVGLYGDKWIDAIIPLQILTVAGIQKAVGTLVGVVFRGKGRPELEARWSALNLVVLTAAVLIGVRWGTPGVAAGVSISAWLVGVPIQLSALRLMGARFSEYVRAVIPGAAMGATSAAVAVAVRQITTPLPPLLAAAIIGVFAFSAAGLVGWFGWRDVLRDFASVFIGMWRSRYPGRGAPATEETAGE